MMTAKDRQLLMYGLIYPAVLGTGLVAMAMQIASYLQQGDRFFLTRMSLAGLFLFFFCISFVAGSKVPSDPPKPKYSWAAFGCDLIEVFFMFCCFLALGLFSQPAATPHPRTAYLVFLVLIPGQMAWRWSVGLKAREWWPLRLMAFVALLFGWLFGHSGTIVTPVVAMFCVIVTLIYVAKPKWCEKWFAD